MTNAGDDLSSKVYQTMEKHKDVFFTVLLNPPTPVSSPLPGTSDPDNLIQCDVMDGRDAFLTMARERHWEFSSLRRAKYSTMAMLFEVHTQGGDKFVYNCNNCRMAVETRYHCKECDVSDSAAYMFLLAVYTRRCPANVHVKYYRSLSNFCLVGPLICFWQPKQFSVCVCLITNHTHSHTHMWLIMRTLLLGLHMPNFSLIGP